MDDSLNIIEEAKASGLDSKTANGIGFADGIPNMVERMQAEHDQYCETHSETEYWKHSLFEIFQENFQENSFYRGKCIDSVKSVNRFVDMELCPDGKVKVYAGQEIRGPDDEPKPETEHKQGELLKTFESLEELVDDEFMAWFIDSVKYGIEAELQSYYLHMIQPNEFDSLIEEIKKYEVRLLPDPDDDFTFFAYVFNVPKEKVEEHILK